MPSAQENDLLLPSTASPAVTLLSDGEQEKAQRPKPDTKITIRRKPVSQTPFVLSREVSGKGSRVKSLPYDPALGTRNICIVGLALSWAVSIACIALAPWTFRGTRAFLAQTGGYTIDQKGQRTFFLNQAGQEGVKLVVNICIAVCTDCLGYIHSTSLRWALRREGALDFNSNLRLLASTRSCSSSRWSTNVVSAFLLMTCYASSGQLFLSSDVAKDESFIVNGIALGALGAGILGQAAISTLCLVNSAKLIPTWSSNPLNTARVLLHDGYLRYRPGRCMLSLHAKSAPSGPSMPAPRQSSLRRAKPGVRHITRLLWALFALNISWAIILLAVARSQSSDGALRDVSIYGAGIPALELNLTALLITIAFQAGITLGLHIAELLVNVSRDESVWRHATRRAGARLSWGVLGSVKAALYSGQSLALFVLKPVTHWLFGLSIGTKGGLVVMNWQGVLPLAAAALLLALLATFLARTRSEGAQPASFGHLQTLVDLIDAWPEDDEQAIWWGDKGLSGERVSEPRNKEVRHAGTDAKVLERVRMDGWYAGWSAAVCR